MEKTASIEAVDSTIQGILSVWIKDLVLILIAGIVLVSLIFLGEAQAEAKGFLSSTRFLLGLIYVFYVPGYLLQAALFPHRGDLSEVERLGLSIGLSLALVPVLALILDRLPWGLRLWSIVIGQGLMIMLLVAATLWRRWAVGAETAYIPDIRLLPGLWWRGLSLTDRRLFLLAGGALLFAGLATTWAFLVPSDADFMTEFYLLGKGGLAEDYPRQAQVGETIGVTLGINNLERTGHTYRVETWVADPLGKDRRVLVSSGDPVQLDKDTGLELPVYWSMPWSGDNLLVEFILFIDSQPQPYRRLALWMNVKP